MQSTPIKSSPKKYTSSMGQVLPGLWVGNIMSITHIVDVALSFEEPLPSSPSMPLPSTSASSSRAEANDHPDCHTRLCSAHNSESKTIDNREVIITVISVLSNPNMIRMAKDFVENQRLRLEELQQSHQEECEVALMVFQKCAVSGESNEDKQNENETKNDLKHETCTIHTHNNSAIKHCFPAVRIEHRIIELKDSIESDLMSVIPHAINEIDEALGHANNIIIDSSLTKHNNEVRRNNNRCNTQDITKKDAHEQSKNKNKHNIDDIKQHVQRDIAKTLKSKRICLIHCAKGQSRSVSLVIAYLLTKFPARFKTFTGSLAHVKSVRTGAMPNAGFALVLRLLEKKDKRLQMREHRDKRLK
ncbi:hypothetical protein ACHAXS_010466 [Conticribra weissflogii]